MMLSPAVFLRNVRTKMCSSHLLFSPLFFPHFFPTYMSQKKRGRNEREEEMKERKKWKRPPPHNSGSERRPLGGGEASLVVAEAFLASAQCSNTTVYSVTGGLNSSALCPYHKHRPRTYVGRYRHRCITLWMQQRKGNREEREGV